MQIQSMYVGCMGDAEMGRAALKVTIIGDLSLFNLKNVIPLFLNLSL